MLYHMVCPTHTPSLIRFAIPDAGCLRISPNGRSSAARTTRSPPPSHLRTSRSLAEPDGLLHPDKSLVTKSRGKSLAASCRRTSRKVCKSRRMSFWHHTHSPSSRHRRTFGSLAELDGPWHSRQSHGQILVPRCRCAVAEGLQVLANGLWQHARQLRVISQSLKVSPMAIATRRPAISESLGEPPQFTPPRS